MVARWMPVVACLAWVAPCFAQGTSPLVVRVDGTEVVFETDTYVGESVTDPPTRRGVPGLPLLMGYDDLAGGSSQLRSQTTNAQGRVPIPPGTVPSTGIVAGLNSEHALVLQGLLVSPGSCALGAPAVFTVSFAGGTPVVQPGATGHLFVNELQVYQHVEAVHRFLTPLSGIVFTNPLTVEFSVGSPSSPASYSRSGDRIRFPGGCGDPDATNWARSFSVVAHEVAHRFLEESYAGLPFPGRLNEGFADFIASLVAGTPRIGVDVKGPGTVVRDISGNAQYTPTPDPLDPHGAGLVVAGALHHTRQLFLGQGLASFELLFGEVLAAHPASEAAVCLALLEADDDDGDLSNGTPHLALIYQGFHVQHGIPWPLSTQVSASVTARNALGNPSSFTASGPPVLGDPITFTVDLATTGHTHAQVFAYDQAANVALGAGGTLLVGGQLLGLTPPLSGNPVVQFALSVPNDPSIAGVAFHAQALHVLGAQPYALSNALDLIPGN